jgi:hypothetical protein
MVKDAADRREEDVYRADALDQFVGEHVPKVAEVQHVQTDDLIAEHDVRAAFCALCIVMEAVVAGHGDVAREMLARRADDQRFAGDAAEAVVVVVVVADRDRCRRQCRGIISRFAVAGVGENGIAASAVSRKQECPYQVICMRVVSFIRNKLLFFKLFIHETLYALNAFFFIQKEPLQNMPILSSGSVKASLVSRFVGNGGSFRNGLQRREMVLASP